MAEIAGLSADVRRKEALEVGSTPALFFYCDPCMLR
jgi:hypothetical protein